MAKLLIIMCKLFKLRHYLSANVTVLASSKIFVCALSICFINSKDSHGVWLTRIIEYEFEIISLKDDLGHLCFKLVQWFRLELCFSILQETSNNK